MANKKIILDPSRWVLDPDNNVTIRYRIVTDDFNVRSAFSPPYSIEAPALNEIFSFPVNYVASSTTSGASIIMRIDWSITPQYDDIKYFMFLQSPADSEPAYLQTVTGNTFSYVLPNTTPTGDYVFTLTLPTTTKTALSNAELFSATITI
jgi:hypothetical protein